ncbi:PREDICTED: turripeptide OL11-like [Ceratosolen solmsi marchali]|uniref:Turripeptide OL11-like n=1 Tax=Ceratosolen solmsi marchali TaxID=326594 RepID=A0AAJ6YG39_9HYME|nr:PREDICTED: turripeptide OL11-like [Ceratosolen solmsi marchali]
MMKLTVIFLATIVLLSTVVKGDDLDAVPKENVGLENCNCIATFEYLPLCASNGVTYSNPSMLQCAKRCLRINDLTKVRDGRC